MLNTQAVLAVDDFSVEVGTNKTFTNYNFHETQYSDDPGNPPPRWAPPSISTASSQDNQAEVNLLAYPGQAGRYQTRIGLDIQWLGISDWDSFEDVPVNITYDVDYTLSANWYSLEGSASTRFYTPVKNTIAQDMIGFPNSLGTVNRRMVETQKTTVKQLGPSPHLELSLDSQVHKQDVGPLGSNPSYVHTASGEIVVNSIEVQFGPKAIIAEPQVPYSPFEPYSWKEGEAFSLSGEPSTPSTGLFFSWDLNGDLVFENGTLGQGWLTQRVLNVPDWMWQDGRSESNDDVLNRHYSSYPVTLKVEDINGEKDEDKKNIRVYNVPPEVGPISGPNRVLVGQKAFFSGKVTDASMLDEVSTAWKIVKSSDIDPRNIEPEDSDFKSAESFTTISVKEYTFTESEKGLNFVYLWSKDEDGDTFVNFTAVQVGTEAGEGEPVPEPDVIIDPNTGIPVPDIRIPNPGKVFGSGNYIYYSAPLSHNFEAGDSPFAYILFKGPLGVDGINSLNLNSLMKSLSLFGSSDLLGDSASESSVLTLSSPDGNQITPEVASNSTDIYYKNADSYEYYVIDNPASGNWTANLSSDPSLVWGQKIAFLGVENPILSVNDPPPNSQSSTLQMNVSHNLVGGNNFSRNKRLEVKILDSSLKEKASRFVDTDDGGNFDGINWWDENIRLNFGDRVQVFENGQLKRSAIVKNISATINTTNSTVSGQGPANTKVHVGIYDNRPHPKNEIVGKEKDIDSSGNFSFEFNKPDDSQAYPLSQKNEAFVWVEDSLGDQTQIWVGSPALEVDVTNNNIHGKYFPSGAIVNLQLQNGSNDKGQLNNYKVDPYGEFNANWRGDSSLQSQMGTGDTLTASFNGIQKSLAFEPVTANIDYGANNKITGKAPANTWVQANVNRQNISWEQQHRNTLTNNLGDFNADYSLDDEEEYDPLDLDIKDEATVTYYNKTSLDTVQYWFGQPRMEANISYNWLEARYLPADTAVTVTISNDDGEKAERLVNTDPGGRLWADSWNPSLEPGDTIKLDYLENGVPKQLLMIIEDLKANVDAGNDTVFVQSSDSSFLRAELSGNDGIFREYQLIDGETSHTFDFANPPGETYNITFNDAIWIRSTPPGSLNQTTFVAGTPKLRANITDNGVEGVNLPSYQDVTLNINDNPDLSFTKETTPQGNVWFFGWEEFGNEYQIKPGDNLKLTYGSANLQMIVSNLTGNIFTAPANIVSGSATNGSSVRVSLSGQDWQPFGYREIENVVAGFYSADFNLDDDRYDPYDIQPGDEFNINETEPLFGHQTIIRASTSQIRANVTHNWLDAEYLPRSTEILIKVNNGSKGSQKGETNASGRYQGQWESWQAGKQRFSFGDTIAIYYDGGPNDGQLIADMTVASKLTGSVDHQTNQVLGETLGNIKVDVWIDDNDDWQAVNRQTTSGADGAYSFDYDDEYNGRTYDISPFDVLRTGVRDNEGNQTIIVFGTPRLEIDLQRSNISGSYFPLDTTIDLSSNANGSNGQTTVSSNQNGNFWLSWEDKTGNILETDDTLNVSYFYEGQNKNLPVITIPKLTGTVYVDEDTVEGEAPLGSEVNVEINPWFDGPGREVKADENTGEYTADYKIPENKKYNITNTDEAEISINDDNANRFFTMAGTSRLFVNLNWDGLEGSFIPQKNTDITVEVKDKDNNAKGTKDLKTDGSGYFGTDWYDENWNEDYHLNFGDTITVKNKDTSEIIEAMTVANPLSATVQINDSENGEDKAIGQAPETGETILSVGSPWEEGNYFKQEVSGSFEVSLGSDFGYSDDGQLNHIDVDGNETETNFGYPRIQVNLTEKTISGEFLSPNIQVKVKYDGADVKIGTSNPAGQIEYQGSSEFEAGKEVKITEVDESVIASHSIASLQFFVDAANKVVYGIGNPLQKVVSYFNPNPWDGPGNWQETDSNSNGQFVLNYFGNGYEPIKLDDEVFVEQSDAKASSTIVYKSVIDEIAPSKPVVSPNRTYINNTLITSLNASSFSADIFGYIYSLDNSPNASLGYFNVSQGSSASIDISSLPEGSRYFHIKARDIEGNFSQQLDKQIIIDNTKPTNASVLINGGAASTSNPSVALSFGVYDVNGVTEMRFAESPAVLLATPYKPYNGTDNITFSGGEGTKTVYTQFKDAASNESLVVSDDITYQLLPGSPQTVLSTSLSLIAKPKVIKAGKATLIKGQLKDASGKSVTGKTIVIKANGKTIKKLKTNSRGVFQFKHKPKKTTKYQASYAGDSSYKAAKSKVVKVTVKKAKKKAKKKKSR